MAGGSEKLNRNLFPEDENPPKKGGRAGNVKLNRNHLITGLIYVLNLLKVSVNLVMIDVNQIIIISILKPSRHRS